MDAAEAVREANFYQPGDATPGGDVLGGAGLETFAFLSVQKDEVYIKVRAPLDALLSRLGGGMGAWRCDLKQGQAKERAENTDIQLPQLKRMLIHKEGSLINAWRRVLDRNGIGRIPKDVFLVRPLTEQ